MSENSSIAVEKRSDGAFALRLVGEISAFHSVELYCVAMQLAGEGGDVLLACKELNSIDLATAQVLLALKKVVRHHGRRFRIEEASADLAGFFQLVGLENALAASASDQVQTGSADSQAFLISAQ
jgi:anti-anti-sigma factor